MLWMSSFLIMGMVSCGSPDEAEKETSQKDESTQEAEKPLAWSDRLKGSWILSDARIDKSKIMGFSGDALDRAAQSRLDQIAPQIGKAQMAFSGNDVLFQGYIYPGEDVGKFEVENDNLLKFTWENGTSQEYELEIINDNEIVLKGTYMEAGNNLTYKRN